MGFIYIQAHALACLANLLVPFWRHPAFLKFQLAVLDQIRHQDHHGRHFSPPNLGNLFKRVAFHQQFQRLDRGVRWLGAPILAGSFSFSNRGNSPRIFWPYISHFFSPIPEISLSSHRFFDFFRHNSSSVVSCITTKAAIIFSRAVSRLHSRKNSRNSSLTGTVEFVSIRAIAGTPAGSRAPTRRYNAPRRSRRMTPAPSSTTLPCHPPPPVPGTHT